MPEETVNRMRRITGVRTVAVEDRDQEQLLVVQTEHGTELTQSLLAQLDAWARWGSALLHCARHKLARQEFDCLPQAW